MRDLKQKCMVQGWRSKSNEGPTLTSQPGAGCKNFDGSSNLFAAHIGCIAGTCSLWSDTTAISSNP